MCRHLKSTTSSMKPRRTTRQMLRRAAKYSTWTSMLAWACTLRTCSLISTSKIVVMRKTMAGTIPSASGLQHEITRSIKTTISTYIFSFYSSMLSPSLLRSRPKRPRLVSVLLNSSIPLSVMINATRLSTVVVVIQATMFTY